MSLPDTKTSASDSDQWLRRLSLTIFDSSKAASADEGLDLSQMRVTFQVHKNTNQSPNLLRARIYNLSPQTENQAVTYRKVSLSAGYQTGRYGQIFLGTIVNFVRGKESAVDSYLDILAGDGDLALNYDTVTKTWAAGTTKEQIVRDQAAALKGENQEISVGHVDLGEYGKQKILRAYSTWSAIRERLRDHASAANADFYINDGKVNILKRTAYMPGEAAVLAPSTGLVGMPEVTPQGIQARCLLNPNLTLGGLVKIETDRLSGVAFEPGIGEPITNETRPSGISVPPATWGKPFTTSFTSPTGTYKILLLEHSGDSRGNPWYSDMVCVALDQSGNAVLSAELPLTRATGAAWGTSAL